MKKIIKHQGGITLVELLLAILILGFIVSGYFLLSSNIMKTNTNSFKDSQSMAYATIISELIKESVSLDEGSIQLQSTVIDESGANDDFTIDQQIVIPKVGEEIGGSLKYNTGKETGYSYKIKKRLIPDPAVTTAKLLKITVTVENNETNQEQLIEFMHYYEIP